MENFDRRFVMRNSEVLKFIMETPTTQTTKLLYCEINKLFAICDTPMTSDMYSPEAHLMHIHHLKEVNGIEFHLFDDDKDRIYDISLKVANLDNRELFSMWVFVDRLRAFSDFDSLSYDPEIEKLYADNVYLMYLFDEGFARAINPINQNFEIPRFKLLEDDKFEG